MNRLPDITMPAEITDAEIKSVDSLEEDLKIIGEGEKIKEDLTADPFIRAPALKPEAPLPKHAIKKKKVASEKQKSHLANARKLAKERKEQAKKEKEAHKLAMKLEEEKLIQQEEQDSFDTNVEKEEKDFELFLSRMDKYKKMEELYKKQEEEKRLAELAKEKELEAKYFNKFQEQQNQKKKLEEIEKNHKVILEQPADFGKYSNYF
jgi:hypothetical protein